MDDLIKVGIAHIDRRTWKAARICARAHGLSIGRYLELVLARQGEVREVIQREKERRRK